MTKEVKVVDSSAKTVEQEMKLSEEPITVERVAEQTQIAHMEHGLRYDEADHQLLQKGGAQQREEDQSRYRWRDLCQIFSAGQ